MELMIQPRNVGLSKHARFEIKPDGSPHAVIVIRLWHRRKHRCRILQCVQNATGKKTEQVWRKPIGSMYAIYGNMDPINIPQMLAYMPAPWILWEVDEGKP